MYTMDVYRCLCILEKVIINDCVARLFFYLGQFEELKSFDC